MRAEWLNRQLINLCVRAGSNGKLGESLGMRLPKNGMLFMIIVIIAIIVMTGIMIIANTNYQYRATLMHSGSPYSYCVMMHTLGP